ncbi:MAG: hypothetical protein AAGF78_08875, partial [Pseudomonadota bacterium]
TFLAVMVPWTVTALKVDGDPTKLAFSIKNAAKDVGYYARMAEEAGAPSVMAPSGLAMLEDARDAGLAEAMVPELIDHYARKMGRG